jgi:hypothetical protein
MIFIMTIVVEEAIIVTDCRLCVYLYIKLVAFGLTQLPEVEKEGSPTTG